MIRNARTTAISTVSLLHPCRYISRFRILPETEPEQDQLLLISCCLLKKRIYKCKIIFAFLRLQCLPVHQHDQRVQMTLIHLLPDFLFHLFRIVSGRVVYLACKRLKRPPVHIQRRDTSVNLHFRNLIHLVSFLLNFLRQYLFYYLFQISFL